MAMVGKEKKQRKGRERESAKKILTPSLYVKTTAQIGSSGGVSNDFLFALLKRNGPLYCLSLSCQSSDCYDWLMT
jgi:hypothetical protein